jgi:hypothetical protein
MADFQKVRPGSPYHNGAAVVLPAGVSTTIYSVRGDTDEDGQLEILFNKLAGRFHNFLYYQQTTPTAFSAADSSAPAANTNAVVTYAAAPNVAHSIDSITWSYDAAPTGGRLTITDGGVTVFDIEITAGGPGFFSFPGGIRGSENSALVITLAAGGAAVEGKLYVFGHRTVGV